MIDTNPFHIKVLDSCCLGRTVTVESLSEKEQAEVESQIRLVSEVAEIEFSEEDEHSLRG